MFSAPLSQVFPVPVVASARPYSEVLSNDYPGQYGILADTPEALYQGIVKSIQCPEPAKRRAAAWRERVYRYHSYETQWRQWERVILEVLGEGDEARVD